MIQNGTAVSNALRIAQIEICRVMGDGLRETVSWR